MFRVVLLTVTALTYSALVEPGAIAQDVSVDNVRFEYSETEEQVIVSYDLIGEGVFLVDLHISINDQPFVPVNTVHGDVGEGITPGVGKTILWGIFDDFPDGIRADPLRFRVYATLTDSPSGGRRLIYIAGGGLLAGAITSAILFLRPDTENDPMPPGRPAVN